ncbi:MAG: septum formation initiator family protein [Chloroflexota bacterium]|nr:septum formation initiator family protein [Chloroflexota bacterium]
MAATMIKGKDLNSSFAPSTLRTLLLLVGLVALLGFVYLGQNGQATMTGRRAQDLKAQLERIERENAQTEVEIAQLTQPSRIAERARALGFRPATISQIIFIVVKNYPVEQKPAAPAMASSSTSSSFDLGALWNDLLARGGLSPTARTVEATSP